jgi:hypothetical protein
VSNRETAFRVPVFLVLYITESKGFEDEDEDENEPSSRTIEHPG